VPVSAAGQRWSSADSVFLREVMEAFADESVNEISIMCSAQSAKTLTILVLLAWAIAEDPGPILWVAASKVEAKKLAKGRVLQLLEKCAPVASKLPRERDRKTTLEIYFPGAPLVITGAESEASLQSTPFRYLILDEARSYPPGALEMVSKRTRSYTHNYKKVMISTPDLENDAVHRAYLAGHQAHYEVKCPACGHFQELRWKEPGQRGGLKWDTNEVTKPEGRWNYEEMEKTIRYECEACGHAIRDVESDRKWLTQEGNGRWVAKNPNAPTNIRSFHWNALLPWWAAWKNQVRELLAATAALKWNDWHPLKDWVNETCGEPWTDRRRYQNDEKFIAKREAEYDVTAPWLEEKRRFCTVDVQGKGGRHYYVVVRAWGLGGASRKLWHEKVWHLDEVKRIISDWKVPDENVAIDAGHFTSEVYGYVVASGYRWKALKGDDKPFFTVNGLRTMYTVSDADPAIGTSLQGRVRPIKLYVWSKPSALDRLTLFQQGDAGDWRIDPSTDSDYRAQVTAYELRERVDSRGVVRTEWHQKRPDDHYGSCELMQIVCAAATDLLSAPREDDLFSQPPAPKPVAEEEANL